MGRVGRASFAVAGGLVDSANGEFEAAFLSGELLPNASRAVIVLRHNGIGTAQFRNVQITPT